MPQVRSLLDRVASAENLPRLPSTAVDIVALSKRPDASAEMLAQVIQTDPALTAQILKLVNSSLFGVTCQVGSIKQAIAMLGFRPVTVMVLSFSLVESLGSDPGDGFDYEGYWRRSLTMAAAARRLAKEAAPRLAEEAFVAALLADLGVVAAWRSAPDLYAPVLVEVTRTGRPLHEVERQLLGTSHSELTMNLLRGWGLPETLWGPAAMHHGEGGDHLSESARQIGNIACASALIASVFCKETPATHLEAAKKSCLSLTGIQVGSLESILNGLEDDVRAMARLLSLNVGQTTNYAQLQAEGLMLLARLSVSAETERAQSEQRVKEARTQATRLEQEKAAILHEAAMDGLTGIANRTVFDRRLAAELSRATKVGGWVGLIMIDVDHFKKFNDTHGHQAGDEVLRAVGACLSEGARPNGVAARYGGEEFAIILSGGDARKTRALAESIRGAIERMIVRHGGKSLRVTASLGVACVEPKRGPVTGAQLVEAADRCLYQAKKSGRNRVEMGVRAAA